MTSRTAPVLRPLFVVLVVLTGAAPASATRAALPMEGTASLPAVLPPTNAVALHAEGSAAPAQRHMALRAAAADSGAVDPGDWDQGYPSVTGDSAGRTYAVWEDSRDAFPHIRFAGRGSGGDWLPSVQIDPTASADQTKPKIAADGSGGLYVVWRDQRNGQSQIYFAHRPQGGTWEASEPISATAEAQTKPAVAVNRRGKAVASWRQGTWPNYHVFTAVRPPGGEWGAAEQRTSVGANIVNSAVAVDDWGKVYLTWDDWTQGQNLFAQRSVEGSWSTPELIRDTSTPGSSGTQIAVDTAGNLHAVWEDGRGPGSEIYAAYRPVGGMWSVNVRLDDGDGGMWSPGLGVDGAGNAVAAWSLMNTDVYGAVQYAGSGWTESQLLAEAPALSYASGASAGLPQTSLVGPQATQSFVSSIGLAGAAAAVAFVGDLATGFSNVFAADLVPPGGMGCGGPVAIAAIASQAIVPQAPAQGGGGVCRAGNGPQAPPQSWDEGFIGPPLPPNYQEGGWDVEEVDLDGQTLYVVDTTGQDGVYDNAADAHAFANTYAWYTPYEFDLDAWLDEDLISGFLPPEGEGPGATPAGPQGGAEEQLGEVDQGGGAAGEGTGQASGALGVPPSGREQDAARARQPAQRALKKLSSGEPLTAEERGILEWHLLIQGIGGTPEELLELWRRSQRFQNLAVPYPGMLLDAGRDVVVELAGRVAEEEAKLPEPPSASQTPPGTAPATGTAQQASGASGSNAPTPNYAQQYQGAKSTLQKMKEMSKADPVLFHSGEFVYEHTPLHIAGRGIDYAFQLTYHSELIYDGPLGWGWEHSYDRRVVPAGGGSLGHREGAGRFDVYSFDGTDYTPPAGRYTSIVSATHGITISDRYGGVEGYYPLDGSPAEGWLRSVADRNGNALHFAYDGQGRLQTVTDTLGRDITFTYDGNDRITAVTDFAGRSATMGYDGNGDLVTITTPAVTGTPNGNDFPLGKTTEFSYTSGFDDWRLNHNLTTIIAPNEVRDGSLTPRTVNTYGTEGFAFDHVVHQSWGGGRSNASGIPAGGEVTAVYTTSIEADAPAGAATKTTITDRGGHTTELWHDGAGHRLRQREAVGGQDLVTDYTYDANGEVTSVTYPADNRVEYTYDEGAADRFAQGNLLERRFVADAARGCDGAGGTPCLDLVTSYTYEPRFQQLQTVTDPEGNTSSNMYDANGNLVRVDFPDVTVGPAAPQAAFQTWTYNAHGQPLSFTDAEGNTTCYAYYDAGPASGYRWRDRRDCGGLDVTTEYGYDVVGNVTVITDARGIRNEHVVNALNQVVARVRGAGTPLDYETRYAYDANDNLVRIDAENVAPDMDGDFHPTGTHRRDGANPWLTTEYVYDLLDNVVRVTREVSATSHITVEQRYDGLENLVSITDPKGNQTQYRYDERAMLRGVTRAVGQSEAVTTTNEYDANGNPIRITDGQGHPTDFVYDGFDRQVGRVDALGNIRTWAYDGNGNVVETALRDGQDGRNPARTITATAPVTLTHAVNRFHERNRPYARERAFFVADVGGGVITPITGDGDADGWVESATTFDRNGNVVEVEDDNGNLTTYAYDALDRVVLVTDALSNTLAYSYDGNGNVIQTVSTERQPDGLASGGTFTTTNTFDALNRLVATSDSLGQMTRYAYDSRGHLVFTSDANGPVAGGWSTGVGGATTEVVTTNVTNNHGNTALFAYDGVGRLLEETYHLRAGGTGAGSVTDQVIVGYGYDDNGNLARRTDPNGHATTYGYDGLNRMTWITYADGTTETMTYDGAGKLVARTDANCSAITHAYDQLNRRVRSDVIRAPGVFGTTLQTFAWDGLSRMVAAGDNNDPGDPSDDSSIALSYDSLSNPVTETQDGDAVDQTYDGVGNRIGVAYPSGTAVTYTYDALHRVSSASEGGEELASYNYVGPWRALRCTYGNGTYTAYGYDDVRRLTEIGHRRSSDDALLSAYSYAYDRAGNRISETSQPGGETVSYSYDSLNRLTRAQSPGADLGYGYDRAGNRTLETVDTISRAYTANEMNEYGSVNGETRTHDANGNLLTRRIVETCVALTGVTVAGPAEGHTDASIVLTSVISPSDPTEPVNYTWSPTPDGGQGTASATYGWAAPGLYTVTLTARNCGGVVSDTHSITLEPPPCPSPLEGVEVGGPTEGYTDTFIVFSSVITPTDATQPITYTWSPDPVTGQGTASVSYTWASPGVYTVTLAAENCGGPVSDTHTIAIEAPPPACPRPLEAVRIEGPSSGLSGTMHAFTGVITPSNATEPITYTWSPDPVTGQGTTSASYTWAAPGVHTVTLKAENCGGVVSDTQSIVIGASPPACLHPLEAVRIDGPTSGLSGAMHVLTGVITPSDATEPITYTWSPDPASGQGTAIGTYLWLVPGVYTVTLTAENCGGLVSDMHSLTITEDEQFAVYLPMVLRAVDVLTLECPSEDIVAPAGLSGAVVVTETLIRYEYDFADRLISATTWVTVTDGGVVTTDSESVHYTYDALGRQVSKEMAGTKVRAVYGAGQVIEERDGGDALAATYVGGVAMERGGRRYFYQVDGVGSVRALADEVGDIQERVAYDPFGAPALSGGGDESGLDNPYLFRGRRYDADVGLYGHGRRRYDPMTGRLVQRGPESLGNPYTFAGNNPLGGDLR